MDALTGVIGRGGYEGIQNDADGNLWIVEDVGGGNGTANPQARQPNRFVYRFVPKDRTDLTTGGTLAGPAGRSRSARAIRSSSMRARRTPTSRRAT